MHDDDWNPRDLRSPIQHLIPTPITLDSDIPFGEGRELIVNIPISPRGINNVYVDDIIPLTVPHYSQSTQQYARVILTILCHVNSWKVVQANSRGRFD